MGEKVYRTMKSAGIGNLVIGVVIMLVGIATGTYIIVNGAKLLKRKSEVLF